MKLPRFLRFRNLSVLFITILVALLIHVFPFLHPANSEPTTVAGVIVLVKAIAKTGVGRGVCFTGAHMGANQCRKPSRCVEAVEHFENVVNSNGSSGSVRQLEGWIGSASQNKNCAISLAGGSIVGQVKDAIYDLNRLRDGKITSLPSSCLDKNITVRPNSSNLEFKRGTEWNPCPNYKFIFQNDGNLVLYSQNRSIWATGTNNKADLFVVQADGNVVLYGGGRAVWATNTGGNPGAFLAIQSDGNLVVYSRNGNALWSTETGGR
ncbi:MAG: hypothetical protein ACK5LW_05370 [Pseudanabaena sp.]|jgi:hypothetical protein